MKLSKDELNELARYGMQRRLADMEAQLKKMHAVFPDEFASPTPPVLRKLARKGNGEVWPEVTVGTNGHGAVEHKPKKRSWTPEQKAKFLKTMSMKRKHKPSSHAAGKA